MKQGKSKKERKRERKIDRKKKKKKERNRGIVAQMAEPLLRIRWLKGLRFESRLVPLKSCLKTCTTLLVYVCG